MLERIHWLGHATFRINGGPDESGPVIYIDPWQLPAGSPPADIILVSHDHHDHCCPDAIESIRTPDTLIVANQRAADVIGPGVQIIRPYQGAVCFGDISIRAIPAYTVNKVYHAQGYGGLGFVIDMMRHDIYYAGDTDLIPEMDRIRCDIALLPVGGAFTMNAEEAAEAAKRIQPTYAIPMHYGREIPGSRDDGKRFCSLVNGGVQPVELPIENESFRVAVF
jgi:L-ascorbate metabolism protein UlaG (beta-lactamase superfamily)